MSAARRFLSAVLEKGEVSEWARFGPIKHLFRNTDADYYAVVDNHVRQYGVLPKPETFEKLSGTELMQAVEPAAPSKVNRTTAKALSSSRRLES
jgi:hypothetical protein